MKNLLVKHVVFGEGKVVEVINRSAPTIRVNNETGEIETIYSNLPNLLVIEFKDGTKRKFQDVALENKEWFIKEEE